LDKQNPNSDPLARLARVIPRHGEKPTGKNHYRTIWISDVHLGMKSCKAEALYEFLQESEAEYLFLVGDIIDLWALRRKWHWPDIYNHVLRNILGKAKYGTDVRYIPGNHDELFRDYLGVNIGNIQVENDHIHTLLDGRKLLIIHGDEFDGMVKHNRWLSKLGGWAYGILLELNRVVNWVRRKLGFSYWSLSNYLKQRVKQAVQYVSSFKKSVVTMAHRRQVDGLVCGHIHRAGIEEIDGILYCNDGDWVESCTAMVEHLDGRLEIIHWCAKDKDSTQEKREAKNVEEVSAGVGRMEATDQRRGHYADASSEPGAGLRDAGGSSVA
jgi:UDP-2,3-diacylglucosamine pyrophosphatase LpxH